MFKSHQSVFPVSCIYMHSELEKLLNGSTCLVLELILFVQSEKDHVALPKLRKDYYIELRAGVLLELVQGYDSQRDS